MVLQIFVER